MALIHERIAALFDDGRALMAKNWPRPPQGHGLVTTDVDTATVVLLYALTTSRRRPENILKAMATAIRAPTFRAEAIAFTMHYGRHVRHRMAGTPHSCDLTLSGTHVSMDARSCIKAAKPPSSLAFSASATRSLPHMTEDGYLPKADHVRRCLVRIEKELSIRNGKGRIRAGAVVNGSEIAIDGRGPIESPDDLLPKMDGTFLVVTGENSLLQTDRTPRPLWYRLGLGEIQHRHEDEIVRSVAGIVQDVLLHREWRETLTLRTAGIDQQIRSNYRGREHIKLVDAEIHQAADSVRISLVHDVVDPDTLIPRRQTEDTADCLIESVGGAIACLVRQCDPAEQIKRQTPYAEALTRWQDVDPGRHMIERVTLNALTSGGETQADTVRRAVFDHHHRQGAVDGSPASAIIRDGHALTLRMSAGAISSTIDLADGIRWNNGALEVKQEIPETVAVSMRGEPLRRVVDHPWLEGVMVKSITRKGRTTRISVEHGWAVVKGEDR